MTKPDRYFRREPEGLGKTGTRETIAVALVLAELSDAACYQNDSEYRCLHIGLLYNHAEWNGTLSSFT